MRPAGRGDVESIVQLVRDLAAYEREPDAVQLDEDALAAALFGAEPQVFAHVAESGDTIVGIAVWFVTFSTWTGRHGIWLEDLYVRPEVRGAGVGRTLIAELAATAVRRGYPRLDFSVLDWNTPAQGFYRRVGAAPMQTWTQWRVEGEALSRLAATVPDRRGDGA